MMTISFLDRSARLATILAALCIMTATAQASTLVDYQARLGKARSIVADLRSHRSSAEEARSINELRQTLPATEKVDWPGGSIDTDNGWLQSGLNTLAQTYIDRDRTVVLDRIDERIEAIRQKVDEEIAAAAATTTKDDDKRKLAEILKREEYQKPTPEQESLFHKLWTRFMNWLAEKFPTADIRPGDGADLGWMSVLLQALLYLGLIVGIGFLVYRFLPYFSGRFGKRKSREKNDRVILGERIGDEESAADLFADAERLARAGELRLAIRKGYIAVLCELADRKVVRLAQHKTNRDYLSDVRPRRELFDNMHELTGSFERNWYGAETADESDWETFRLRYRQTIGSV